MWKRFALGCAVGTFYASSAWATVMVLPVEGANLKPEEKDAIWQLVAQAYQAERRDSVASRQETEAAIAETGSYPDAARKVGASEYAFISAVRLEERIVLSGTLYDAQGKVLHSAKMTASGLDDVEVASERLMRALVRRQSARETRDIESVTKTESKAPSRTWVERVSGFKVGVTYPFSPDEDIAPMLSVGYNGRWESTNYFLEFGAGAIIPANADEYDLAYGGVYAEIGGSLYLTKTNVSPYVGAGVMPRLASATFVNLVPFAQAGLMFFRESSSRLYMDLRVGQNVLPVGFNEAIVLDDDSDDKKLYPTEFTFALGVGF